jgi:hypothetical protein
MGGPSVSVWGEFWDYLEVMVFDANCGKLTPQEARRKAIAHWGGTIVPPEIPRNDPKLREAQIRQIEELVAGGIAKRTARMKVRGK